MMMLVKALLVIVVSGYGVAELHVGGTDHGNVGAAYNAAYHGIYWP